MTACCLWQVLGLPTQERQALELALDKISTAAGPGLAALLTEGWYMAATREWWTMQAREVLLLQHMASSVQEVKAAVSMALAMTTALQSGCWQAARVGMQATE